MMSTIKEGLLEAPIGTKITYYKAYHGPYSSLYKDKRYIPEYREEKECIGYSELKDMEYKLDRIVQVTETIVY